MRISTQGRKFGARPHQWISGPNETDHDSYYAWLQCRNQARFRKEPWDLTFDQWQAHWAGQWHLRGRLSDQLCITRQDPDLPWSNQNVHVISRRDLAYRSQQRRIAARAAAKPVSDQA